jgi:4-hydroxy-3-methylbut-2-en-1-yl diphosphate synthase IspG/GcpE
MEEKPITFEILSAVRSRKVECEKIQPCPYCGQLEMHVLKTDDAFGNKIKDMYHVTCCGCAAFGPLHEKLRIAIKLWNYVSDAWYDNLSEDPAISQDNFEADNS